MRLKNLPPLPSMGYPSRNSLKNSQAPQRHEDFRIPHRPPPSISGAISESSDQNKQTVTAEIVRRWEQRILGIGECVL